MNMSRNKAYVTTKELVISVILPLIPLAILYFLPFFQGISKFIWAVIGMNALVVFGSIALGSIKNKDFRYNVFSFQQKVLACLLGLLIVMNVNVGVNKEILKASIFLFFSIDVITVLPGVLLFAPKEDDESKDKNLK
ncbi:MULTISPECIES: hypothetical protein [Bacillus]|uniref:Uncharacterized protein n=3 Tax=Bacillus thuringiensis TaxID=1428 RepID=A0AAP4Q6B3_BACTU|nr:MULTISPECIES: hypothetical protein [Bacillus]AFV21872.1 hypothetical protein BTB_502p05670 [Bacillus thuringiensis Bt407]EEM25103.1 Integral membrane protein, interacts with FtsH [Bacillus thuringiensis Bt407]ERI00950.1 hypothetical protein BTCBT_002505 [Bacillus thuringiensis T01-328]MBN6707716.1 hypothetical protein [Bacillus thuringiensis]MDF9599359.1 hypothetical protein [Bacillus cereus]